MWLLLAILFPIWVLSDLLKDPKIGGGKKRNRV